MKYWLLASLALAGCGDNSSSPGGGDDGPDPEPGALYVGATRVFTGDSDSIGYLFTTPSIDAGTVIDLGKAIEIEDAWVFGDANPYFWTATIFAPEITQWTISEAGVPVKGPTVSFANQGVAGTYTAAATAMWSPTKSYFVDSSSGQVVVWNPTAMTFIKTIPIDVPEVAGMTPDLEIAVRPDRVFVTTFWESADSQWTEFGSQVQVTTIDPATDTVAGVTTDNRCQTIAPAGVAADGTAYFSPWDYHAAVRGVFGAGFGSSSCALRIVPAGAAFDAGWSVDLSALVGGKPAGGLRVVEDGSALIHVWDASLVAATPDTWADDRFAPGYKWYRWQVGDAAATELPNQTGSTEGGEWRGLDGKTVTYNPNAEYTETTLLSLGTDGQLTSHLVIPGWITNMIRAR